jgi:hypothetical protein
MRRLLVVLLGAAVLLVLNGAPSSGRDRPFSTADLVALK